MSHMKRYLEDVMADMGSDEINDHVVAEAARRMGEPTVLGHKDFRVVMCDKCTGTTLIKGRHDVKEVGHPATCSCGGTYKIIDPTAQAVGDLLADGSCLKKESEVKVGDIVEPLNWGGGGGWMRQLAIEVEPENHRIRYIRPFVTGTFYGAGPEPHLRCEDYWAHYSNDSDCWVKVWEDSTTLHWYYDKRRQYATKAQLELYWQRLHFAIERECTDVIENEHELRYRCMELEHRCHQVKATVPDMPTKEQVEAGMVM